MTTTDPEPRKRLALLAQEDRRRIDPLPTGLGIVEPPPPYHAGPRRKLPSWAAHLRDLRALKLEE